MGAPSAEDESSADGEPIPISAIQHAVYCLRQAALIHLERLWAENVLTAEGHILHQASDDTGSRKVRGVRRVTALHLASRMLRIAGVADLVEFHPSADDRETPYPVEIKRGRPKLHRADEAQLCAQALCLEEMTGRCVPEGALFYAQTRRRTVVRFDSELRALTKSTIDSLRDVFLSHQTPPATYKAALCRACSLIELCRPKLASKPALAWRERALAAALRADDDPLGEA
ncbi:MAG: CRISPR-associated protein Cas4 [Hyphomonas sp.]|nr:CRISPR-associated protein Cas4 [Hyphomonas sp.]